MFAPRAEPDIDSKSSKAAIAGLDWLVRHQNPKGYWTSIDLEASCVDPEAHCSSRGHELVRGFHGKKGYNVGVTGLALLAFLSRGNSHLQAEKPEYRLAI